MTTSGVIPGQTVTEVIPQTLYDFLPALVAAPTLALTSDDVIVAAPGFEDRTLALADSVAGAVTATAILVDYAPINPENRLLEVRERLASKGINVTDIVQYHRFAPADFDIRLASVLRQRDGRRILLDISTMSKLLAMLVLNVARTLNLQVRIFYAEASTYWPTEMDFEKARAESRVHQPSLQVFTGVHGVVRVDSLASVAMQGHQTAALVFMSFNDALTQVLLNTVYPGRLFLINGRPPVHQWRERATAWIHDQVRREWESDNPVEEARDGIALPKRTVSTLDYRETVMLLLNLYWELSAEHRILLAPAGSKLQAVGCFLVKALHPDIHIEYPSPEGFAPEYSTGIGSRWLLDFGDLADRLNEMRQVERREHLEIELPNLTN
jgi:hypothetical protein